MITCSQTGVPAILRWILESSTLSDSKSHLVRGLKTLVVREFVGFGFGSSEMGLSFIV